MLIKKIEMITKEEVLGFQKDWGDGIVSMSTTFKDGGNYTDEAIEFIKRLYAYESEQVLFKPTLAADVQFRLDKLGALSYFVGSNPDYSEDSGFAIKGWNSVKWENEGIKILEDCAVCMGNYFFGMEGKEDLKVEYTIVLKKIDGTLKMILHDSHLPYQQ
ncbi:MAG: phosphoribosyl-AMP cyclohydrolase [Flavobacteriales bacterium]|nr:phosphoribosyl-AMP cyclohydrolase [Flavobacteriales bacterium]|tara:strand:+ start:747 stop:1226 length:480 start_codon:yes stop_codon:yes gene_type:complete